MVGEDQRNRTPQFHVLAVLCVAVAVAMQVWLSVSTAYVWDEDREWIPTALAISLDPDNLNLPLRTDRHGALAAYFIRIGGEIAGYSHLGFRWINIAFSVVAALYVGLIARYLTDSPAAAAAAIAAFVLNECAIMTYATAFQISPYMAFSAAGLYYLVRFLDTEREGYAVATALCLGLAFLVYEIGILTVAASGLYALYHKGLGLFRMRAVYLAAALLTLVALPDLYANAVAADRAMDHRSYLDRIGRFGVTPIYLGYYLYGAMEWAYPLVLDRPYHVDGARGFGYMNVLLGAGLLFAVGWSVVRCVTVTPGQDLRHRAFLIWMFLFIFGFFSLIETGGVTGDAVGAGAPIYVGLSVVPAAILFGATVGRGGFLGLACAAALVLGACASVGRMAFFGFEEFLRRDANAVAQPEVLPPPDGRMVPVRVYFDVCDICPDDYKPVLTRIFYGESDGLRVELADAGGEIAGAELGTADRDFAVRNTFLTEPRGWWGARNYAAEYALRADGETFATATAAARVPFRADDPEFRPDWPAPFWVPTRE